MSVWLVKSPTLLYSRVGLVPDRTFSGFVILFYILSINLQFEKHESFKTLN
jgi:hypothetical protein